MQVKDYPKQQEDHLALIHIIKSKAEPTMTKIKRLLEILSSYSFNLYYIKGKDMILSAFLSWSWHHKVSWIFLNLCSSRLAMCELLLTDLDLV